MKPRSVKGFVDIFYVFIVIIAAIAFIYKVSQYGKTLLTGDIPGFAVVQMVTYFVAVVGFVLLLIWSFLKGHFKDVEGPKYRMMEREAELDRQEQLEGR